MTTKILRHCLIVKVNVLKLEHLMLREKGLDKQWISNEAASDDEV